jgi:hypothetical protein
MEAFCRVTHAATRKITNASRRRPYADMKTGVQEVPVPEFAVQTIEKVIRLLFWM